MPDVADRRVLTLDQNHAPDRLASAQPRMLEGGIIAAAMPKKYRRWACLLPARN